MDYFLRLQNQLVHIDPLGPGSEKGQKSHPIREKQLMRNQYHKILFLKMEKQYSLVPLELTAQGETLDHHNDAKLA